MSKIFEEIDNSFKEFTILDQTKFAVQVNEYIHNLSKEKQKKIKEKLGVSDLTDEVMRKAIATSGTSIVFAVIVEVSGFGFYTTATTLMASFAGLFGITLPFGFYTGLTSTIAVLANPIFIIPFLLGGGALLVNQHNKSLRNKLSPIIVMQIVLPYMSNGSELVDFQAFIKEWVNRYEDYKNLNKELENIECSQEHTRNQLSNTDRLIKGYTVHIEMIENELLNQKEYIKSDLKNTPFNEEILSSSFAKTYPAISGFTKRSSEIKIIKK